MTESSRSKRREAKTRRTERRRGYSLLLVAVAFLAVSWAFARWAPIRRASEFELKQISCGINLLVAGALPWLLQWAGVATGLLGVSCFSGKVDRRHVLKGAAVPLILGAVWWASLIVIYWNEDPLKAMLDLMVLSVREQVGGFSLGQELLHGVIGPLTAPFMLRGPISMTGKSYVLAGLSTAAVTAVWIVIARIMDRLSQEGKLSRRQWLLIGFLMLLWLLPVIIRSVKMVAEVA